MTPSKPQGDAQEFLMGQIRAGIHQVDDLRAKFFAHYPAKPNGSLELRFDSALLTLVRRRLIYRHPVRGWVQKDRLATDQ